ncbi:hypothetical protein GALL_330100 [mine drainage metagenome]|uniref:Uncharacterized protein n=1 Tax=mine drainage metagenome TaxID=410659 RepID=A0A1J5QZJ1_9ZZZZ
MGGIEARDGARHRLVYLRGAGGELPHQILIDPIQLEPRRAARAQVTPPPHHRQPGRQVVGEHVVVDLRDRYHRVVQGSGVHRQPPTVRALDLVRDHHMGVQVRIPGPGVPVVKRRGQHPTRRALLTPTRASPSEQGRPLDEPQRVLDRGPVGCQDRAPGRVVGHRPQRRDRLRWRERQIEPRHRARVRLSQLHTGDGLDCRRPPLGGHRVGELGELGRDALGDRGEHRVRAPQRRPGHRIPAGAEKVRHRRLGDRGPHHQTGTIRHTRQPRAEPAPGRVARIGVVGRQRRLRRPVAVPRGGVLEQVLVARTGRQPVHRHHQR